MVVQRENTIPEQAISETVSAGPSLALDVRDLSVRYNNVAALTGITFQVSPRETLGIIGPNGGGKSSLMKSILGLVKPWHGSVQVFGQPNTEQRKIIGYMPQIEDVEWDFPVTVADVALMGRYARRGLFRRPSREDREAVGTSRPACGRARHRSRRCRRTPGS